MPRESADVRLPALHRARLELPKGDCAVSSSQLSDKNKTPGLTIPRQHMRTSRFPKGTSVPSISQLAGGKHPRRPPPNDADRSRIDFGK